MLATPRPHLNLRRARSRSHCASTKHCKWRRQDQVIVPMKEEHRIHSQIHCSKMLAQTWQVDTYIIGDASEGDTLGGYRQHSPAPFHKRVHEQTTALTIKSGKQSRLSAIDCLVIIHKLLELPIMAIRYRFVF